MTEREKIEFKWNIYVDEIFTLNDSFSYVDAKRLAKNIANLQLQIQKKILEITTTIELTEFNEHEEIEQELVNFLNFCKDMDKYLENFTRLEPKTKLGYNNYISNAIAFL